MGRPRAPLTPDATIRVLTEYAVGALCSGDRLHYVGEQNIIEALCGSHELLRAEVASLRERLAAAEKERDAMHRRAQEAEGIIAKAGLVEGRPQGKAGRSVGRALANYAASLHERERDEALAALERATDYAQDMEGQRNRLDNMNSGLREQADAALARLAEVQEFVRRLFEDGVPGGWPDDDAGVPEGWETWRLLLHGKEAGDTLEGPEANRHFDRLLPSSVRAWASKEVNE